MMKKLYTEISECYTYDSFKEFEAHYEIMIANGFKPHSDSSRPDFYYNKEMDIYFAQYDMQIRTKERILVATALDVSNADDFERILE